MVDRAEAADATRTLDAMLTAGPMHDIFRADEARALVELIGTHAKAVNESAFDATFVALQSYAVDEFVLAITRLFDRPRRSYPLRSLPAIVEYVIGNAELLPAREPYILESALKHLGAPISGLGRIEGSAATRIAMAALQRLMPSPETHAALDALKALRDKQLAHPEHIAAAAIPKTTWAPADELLRTAQLMLSALGSLTSTAYTDDAGNYFLNSDAQRASVATHRLLRKLGIAPPLPHEA